MLGWVLAGGAAAVAYWQRAAIQTWWQGQQGGGATPTPNPMPPPGVLPTPPNPAGPTSSYAGPLPPFQLAEPYPGAWQNNGAFIQQYQGALAYLAYQLDNVNYEPGNVFGTYDGTTRQAVMAFQKDNGLTQDGETGPATATAMSAAVALVQGANIR